MVSSPLTIELALLGFVREKPMHAYEIYRILSEPNELGRVWHLKQSQLYALLNRLDVAGYISGTIETHGSRPPRKVMSLTTAGHTAFKGWLRSPVAHGRDFRLEFLAKLYFAIQASEETVSSLIHEQRSVCHARLAVLRCTAGELEAGERFDRLVVEFRITQTAAILTWLETCATTLVPAGQA